MGRDHLGQFQMGSDLAFARGVLLLEDCEGTFNWIASGTGGDDVHAFATAAAFMGGHGMQLKTRTTGTSPNDILTASKNFSFPESGLLVARCRLAMVQQAAIKYVGFRVGFCAGAEVYQARLKHTPATPKVEYQEAGGADVPVAGMGFVTLDGAFCTLELVVDCLANKYVSLAWNGVRADLAGVALFDGGAASIRYAYVALDVVTVGAAPAEMYVDSVYVGEFLDL